MELPWCNLLIKAVLALLLTTILWGSSFPVIKIVVGDIGGFKYTWIRGLIAFIFLTPIALFRLRNSYSKYYCTLIGGLYTGIVYSIGLWLQGTGTGYTSASNSAFITSLNVVFVHLYIAVWEKRYSKILAAELLLALTGLYLLTAPSTGFSLGDLLVLCSAFMWAWQVILVSKYNGDPFIFTWAEIAPSILFIIPDKLTSGEMGLEMKSLIGLTYLGVACSAGAFTFQVYGQKYVKPEIAALTYLLEPVFASIFAWIALSEYMVETQIIGAALILIATGLANYFYYKSSVVK